MVRHCRAHRYKADIEAVYKVAGHGGLLEMVVGAVLRHEYL